MDVVHAVSDVWLQNQIIEQRNCGLDAINHELRQRALQPHHALVAGLAMNDQLTD